MDDWSARKPLTIVSYHYVRPIKSSQYIEIKGLEKTDFEGQIEYIMQHYNVVSMEHIVASIHGEEELPQMALLLAFDDGFSDHYLHVFPHLVDLKIPAAFYPCVSPTMQRKMLDVHKIHFILATTYDKINNLIHGPKNVSKSTLVISLHSRDVQKHVSIDWNQ